jgi:hypothetical protein
MRDKSFRRLVCASVVEFEAVLIVEENRRCLLEADMEYGSVVVVEIQVACRDVSGKLNFTCCCCVKFLGKR